MPVYTSNTFFITYNLPYYLEKNPPSKKPPSSEQINLKSPPLEKAPPPPLEKAPTPEQKYLKSPPPLSKKRPPPSKKDTPPKFFIILLYKKFVNFE